MTRLEVITAGCLKCKAMLIKNDLLDADVYCLKNYDHPHIKDHYKWVGHCDHLDYDEESCAKYSDRLQFCRRHAEKRLSRL